MPANASILATKGNAGKPEWGAFAGILFSSSREPFRKPFHVQPYPRRPRLVSTLPPVSPIASTRKNAGLFKPSAHPRDTSTPSANLSSGCHPGHDSHHSRSVLKPPGQCPHEGSAHRPDMGILQHSWTPALLIQELAGKSRLVRNLQSWCTRATTRFAQNSKCRQASAEVPGRRMMKSNHLALLLTILVFASPLGSFAQQGAQDVPASYA